MINALAASQQKVLVVKKKNHWIFPGGKPQASETDIECLIREFQEELPETQIMIGKCLGIFEGVTPNRLAPVKVIIYQAQALGGITPAAEISLAQWASLFQAFLLPLSPITRKILMNLWPIVNAS